MCLNGCDRRGTVCRRPEERFSQCCFSERVAYGGGSVIFWGGISYDGKTELVLVPSGGRGGGLNAARYITNFLEEHVVPYASMFDEGFLLMQDNAPCHNARAITSYLREVGIYTRNWPAMSPDLNPIEHMWDYLKSRVRKRNPAPSDVAELKEALLEEWDAIPQDYVKKLIRSMKNRLNCVKNARAQRSSESNSSSMKSADLPTPKKNKVKDKVKKQFKKAKHSLIPKKKDDSDKKEEKGEKEKKSK
ncbi:hypothetical protein MSG28_003393 [Choristoneura fumiferana]|uniref:Uncharacterized protein n=1 Tax=Choristoneura fumiferana TaxID=7141 RepID=A0ACC0KEX6_CHOFU|nr:hypothetical protein MSG28_003393 [Choristoneura fumiferana]